MKKSGVASVMSREIKAKANKFGDVRFGLKAAGKNVSHKAAAVRLKPGRHTHGSMG